MLVPSRVWHHGCLGKMLLLSFFAIVSVLPYSVLCTFVGYTTRISAEEREGLILAPTATISPAAASTIGPTKPILGAEAGYTRTPNPQVLTATDIPHERSTVPTPIPRETASATWTPSATWKATSLATATTDSPTPTATDTATTIVSGPARSQTADVVDNAAIDAA